MDKRQGLFLCTFAVLLLISSGACAGYPLHVGTDQVLQDLGTRPVIGGVTVECPGAIIEMADISDLATTRSNAILLSTEFAVLPPSEQIFVFAHLCAHREAITGDESDADRIAIQTAKAHGWLNEVNIDAIERFFGSDSHGWSHAPGATRLRRLRQYYAND
ncbi:MAG: hypothetical protein U0487_02735 [Patescibacteria group bacterium]